MPGSSNNISWTAATEVVTDIVDNAENDDDGHEELWWSSSSFYDDDDDDDIGLRRIIVFISINNDNESKVRYNISKNKFVVHEEIW